MTSLWRDVRYNLRILARSPGFTAMVVGILAVGMGGSMMIFSIFNELNLRPFPVPEQERLVDLAETGANRERWPMSYRDFHDWRRQNQTFDCMTVWDHGGWNLALGDRAERINGIRVTYDYFDVLHVRPALGRRFVEEDDRPSAPRVVILSAPLWRRLYGEDPAVLGRSLRLDGEPHTIVGVLPTDTVFPVAADLWVPLAGAPASSSGWYLQGMGRLKAGVPLARAQADLERIHRGMIDERPVNKTTAPRLTPLRASYLGEHRHVPSLLLLVAGLVLLLACCNITGMMLARGMTRSQEVAVRMALGAPRRRIIRQMLTEMLLLCVLGVFLGALLSHTGLTLLLRSMADRVEPWRTFATDGRIVAFCAGLIGLATILSGLIPALQVSSGRNTEGTLRATASRSTASVSGRRSLNVIVAGEIALAMSLSVGAGLLLLAFWNICRVPPGFRVEDILAYRISLPVGQYMNQSERQAFFEDHLARVRSLPGVQAASLSSYGPMGGSDRGNFDVEGVALASGALRPMVLAQHVMPDYFETMGMELLAGRPFTTEDCRLDSERTAIVNESFAKHMDSRRPVLDQRIAHAGSKDWMRVIGVTRDVKHYGLDKGMGPAVYLPCGRYLPYSMTAFVRTTGDPLALVATIRQAVRFTDPALSIFAIETMKERVRRSLWVRRTYSWLIGVFAVVAAVMAVGGIYGIMSYSVSQQTQEMGIRLALGARAGDIIRHVLARGGRLIGIGLGAGLLGALGMGRLLAGLLFGVSPTDVKVLLAVAALLLTITLLACYLPARRAARIDPMVALRCE